MYLNNDGILELATKLHNGQKRHGGEPYITHPIAVAKIALAMAKQAYDLNPTYDSWIFDKIYQAALLHDVIEDCEIADWELEAAGVDPQVVGLVIHLTRVKGENYGEYLVHNVLRNEDASLIKLADLKHNFQGAKGARVGKYDLAMEIIITTHPVLAPLKHFSIEGLVWK